ncbi:MAG: Acylamino-acid-releasing enzyme [uncultured Rubrobacteraceae bacterium]|uniref:Acylamino-acid-releasing enzyme n=1 Tax=uncultured Rubrobacteraceae bacterium TaxID=349277 RepID=A0A6J4P697_9ACTN|nr:MAG: Acylamino-acid-releasing enzyme [uncultured Rubrobacteraceae bacterium]
MGHDFGRYLKIRGAWGAGWSPDGQRVSFLTEITGVPQVWEVPAGGGWPEQLTFHGERVSGAEYSPTKDEILFGMDAGGNERSQLFLLGQGGGEERDLTRDPGAIHYSGGFSPDGARVAFTATRRNGTDFDVFVQDVPDGEPEVVWEVSGYHTVSGWGPDGSFLIVARHRSNTDNDLYRLDLESGEATLLTPHEGEARFRSPNVTPDGGRLYLATDRDGDFVRLARLDLATLELGYLTPDDHDVEEVELSPDGRLLAVTRNVGGYSDLMLFNGRGGRMPDPEVPRGILGGLAFSPDSKKLAFTLVGPTRNPDVWTMPLPDGEARRLTRSSTAGIPPRSFRTPTIVRYPSFDGLEIPAVFYEPENSDAPVVVNVHGGPESQSRPTFAPVTQYLLGRGHAVLLPNVRGSTGYGKRYTHLDDVRLRMDSVKDLAHAAYWLRERGHERIAVMGGSYGGFMVLAALTEYPDLWSAGVDIVGIANLVTFLENTGSYRRALREPEYGSLENDGDFLRSISPIHKADRITAPLMVVHGKNDPRVPVGEAEQIVARVRENGGRVEYLLYEDEGHGLAKLANRLDAYPRIAAFLDDHLGSPAGAGPGGTRHI